MRVDHDGGDGPVGPLLEEHEVGPHGANPSAGLVGDGEQVLGGAARIAVPGDAAGSRQLLGQDPLLETVHVGRELPLVVGQQVAFEAG